MDMMPAIEKASRMDVCNKARLRIGDDLRRHSFENASNDVEGLKNNTTMRNKPLLRLNFQNNFDDNDVIISFIVRKIQEESVILSE
jgi:hypothetical protein